MDKVGLIRISSVSSSTPFISCKTATRSINGLICDASFSSTQTNVNKLVGHSFGSPSHGYTWSTGLLDESWQDYEEGGGLRGGKALTPGGQA